MIRFQPGNYGQDDWHVVTAGLHGLGLMQDWSYGEAKADTAGWQVERGVLADGDEIVGAAQVLIRPLPVVGGGLAWVNRGPLARADADPLRLFAALRSHYVEGRGLYLRIAPALDEVSVGLPTLQEAGFRPTATPGWASAVLDLTPDIEVLRAGLRQNWRNALNKAERADGVVLAKADQAGYDGFLGEFEEFVRDRGIATTVTTDLLRALQRYRSADAKMHCYRCRLGNTPLGSALFVRTGDTVEYLAGTLLDAGRKFSVGQLLLWRAICDSREACARWFDVGGMDLDVTPKGIFDFKSGVGGRRYRLAPEIEAVNGGVRSALVRWRVERSRAGGVQ